MAGINSLEKLEYDVHWRRHVYKMYLFKGSKLPRGEKVLTSSS